MNAASNAARDLTRYLTPLTVDPRRKGINLIAVTTKEAHRESLPFCSYAMVDRVSEILEVPCNVSTLRLDEMLKVEFFRGLPWTELPVVSDPWYRIGLGRANLVKGVGDKVGVAEVFEVHDAYFHHDNREYWDDARVARDRYLTSYVYSKMFGDTGLVMVGSQRSDEILSMTAGEMMEPAAGTMRLEYSYRFNMRAIAGKLIDSLPRPDRFALTNRLRSMCGEEYLGGVSDGGFYHPLALQLLYALRRNGPVSTKPFSSKREALADLYEYPRCYEPRWGGTGKHPSLRIRPDTEEAEAEKSLFVLGLVELSEDRDTFRISESGERFLSMLHPDCEDPDVLTRWADTDTGLIAGRYRERIDAWLLRFFRKLKTRVNEIDVG